MHPGPTMTVGVLGAGVLGLTCALRLAQAGESVVVLEKESVPGGLAAGFPVGGAHLERFYHHLFGTDRSIVGADRRAGPGCDLYWGTPNTSVLRDGRCYPLNSAGAVLRFDPLPLIDRSAWARASPTSRRYATIGTCPTRRRPSGSASGWASTPTTSSGGRSSTASSAPTRSRSTCPGSGRASTAARPRWATCAAASTGCTAALADEIGRWAGASSWARGPRRSSGRATAACASTPPRGAYHFDRLAVTLPTRLFLRSRRTCPTRTARAGSRGRSTSARTASSWRSTAR